MTDHYFKTRIERISERDFWNSMKTTPGLRAAIAAGRTGRRSDAYRLLGEYHAQSMACEAAARISTVHPTKQAARELKKRADAVLRHDITGWHTHRRQFGKRIDFNADFGRSGQYGFHYLHWLTPVIDQFILTGDNRYRDCFIDIIKQYYSQRTTIVRRIPHLDPVYYELGAWSKARLILPAYAILAGDPALDTEAREAMLKLLMGFGRSLLRLQKTDYRPGNWQIVGCSALYHLGAVFPEWRESATWRHRGNEVLMEHARRDYFADGGHGERCWGYGFMSLNGMIDFYETACRHGLLTPPDRTYWTRFLRRGLRWFAYSTSPTGHALNYGDGQISNADTIFATATRLFPDLARKPGLLGVDRARSVILRPSGYAFMRGGEKPSSPFMSINFGRWGGFHTHRDLLDFSLWSFGRPLIEEVGRWGSYDNPLDPFFRSEQAHNQIVIEHMRMEREKHEAHDVRWHGDTNVDLFSAWHEAYPGIRIQRQIVFVKPSYFLIYDVITSREYIFQAGSYIHSPVPFVAAGRGQWKLAGSPNCLVAVANPGEIRKVVTSVDYDTNGTTGDSNAKDGYTFAEQRHRLVFTKWREVGNARPITFAMLLVPFDNRSVPRAAIEPMPFTGDTTGQAAAFAVRLGARRDLVVFNPSGVRLKYGTRASTARITVRSKQNWIDLK